MDAKEDCRPKVDPALSQPQDYWCDIKTFGVSFGLALCSQRPMFWVDVADEHRSRYRLKRC